MRIVADENVDRLVIERKVRNILVTGSSRSL